MFPQSLGLVSRFAHGPPAAPGDVSWNKSDVSDYGNVIIAQGLLDVG